MENIKLTKKEILILSVALSDTFNITRLETVDKDSLETITNLKDRINKLRLNK